MRRNAMARKKTATAEAPPAGVPPSDTNGTLPEEATTLAPPGAPTTYPSEPPPGTGNRDKRKPAVSFKYPTDRTTTIEVAVWPNQITLQSGEQVQVYAVTIQRSYLDREGEWQKNGSYRGHELPVLMHALTRAHAWILDQRELNTAF
jgi:hypothetical protein